MAVTTRDAPSTDDRTHPAEARATDAPLEAADTSVPPWSAVGRAVIRHIQDPTTFGALIDRLAREVRGGTLEARGLIEALKLWGAAHSHYAHPVDLALIMDAIDHETARRPLRESADPGTLPEALAVGARERRQE